MMLERAVEVSHEAIRLWTLNPHGDTWHLDEVFCKINGQLVYLWRAVDQDGETLDVLVQKRRNAKAAKRFFRKLLKGLRYVPRAIVTDKLPSYEAAKKDVMPNVVHQRGRRLNNRAENSHQPTRSESGRCDASSRCDTPSASSRCMPRSRITFDQDDTCCGRATIGH